MSYDREKLADLAVGLVRRRPSLTAAEASAMLGVHRHTLQRALRSIGANFALLKRRAAVAHLELRFTRAETTPLKEVWTELGFPSASSFARYVRHATGRSPTELRAQLGLGQNARKRAKPDIDVGKAGWYR